MPLVKLFGKVRIEGVGSGAMTLTLKTDMPGTGVMATRHTEAFDCSVANVVTIGLGQSVRGRLISLAISGSNTLRLEGLEVWTKVLDPSRPTSWQWISVPGVERTPDQWRQAPLPIEPTPQIWSKAPLPIEPTSDQWLKAQLPLPGVDETPRWVDLEQDD